MNPHTICIINGQSSVLNDFPSIRIDCIEENSMTQNLINGINEGCSTFVTSNDCLSKFLDNFLRVHDMSISKYEKKLLVIVDFNEISDNERILTALRHKIITRWLPLTLYLNRDVINEQNFINIWSAFPFSDVQLIKNQFFLENASFLNENQLIPHVSDLGGIEIVTSLMKYAPFVSIERVNPGEGNANQYGSNESLTVKLSGIEGKIMTEFCSKFNCTISARLEYDEELWGWGFPNHTGTGILGAVLKYDADLTGAGCYLMGDRYNWIQYTPAIQLSSVINVLPKPGPLPYWYTPILPFTGIIWTCVILILIGSALIVYYMEKIQKKLILNGNMNQNLTDLITNLLKLSLFQSTHINRSSITNSVFYGLFLMYSLIIGNFYLGGLSSIMTVTPYEAPIDSLYKLVSTNLIWGGTSVTWIFAIQQSSDPAHKLYSSKFIEISIEKVQSLVKTRNMAVVCDKTQGGTVTIEGLIDQNDSQFMMIMQQPMYHQYTALIASKTWPYMEQLNRIAYMQQESGIQKIWEYEAMVNSMDHVIQRNLFLNMKPAGNSEPVKLSVFHVIGALFLLIFGHLIAFLVFLIEIFFENSQKNKIKLKKKHFFVTEGCISELLEIFDEVHYKSVSQYHKKSMVLIVTSRNVDIQGILQHKTIQKVIPLTVLLKLPSIREIQEKSWIEIYKAFPLSNVPSNRFFLSNFSFEHHTSTISSLTNLHGIEILGAFFDYPPFTSVQKVVSISI
uniref:CSON002663 protein n=1 Tax=Culicoides sonorensis TaxID=179676 RepID=A0A336LSD3_CULSO